MHKFDDADAAAEMQRKKSFDELSELFNCAYLHTPHIRNNTKTCIKWYVCKHFFMFFSIETIVSKHEEFKNKLGEDDDYPVNGHDEDLEPDVKI